jgi:SAM-dependent methyltransferase
MTSQSNPWWAASVICPECGKPFSLVDRRCACGFAAGGESPIDLRPKKALWRTLNVPVQTTARADLEACDLARPSVTYDGPSPLRDSSELFSAVAARFRPQDRLLDLGCGPRDQAVVAAHYDLRYAAIDYSSTSADLLADAHAMPFADASFDLVFSYAVFEHLHNPYLAASEVARVLAPGGIFFGTISQGEPFHDSYFHHTPFGVLALLRSAGFVTRRLWPSYDTLHALAVMGRYPRATKLLIEALHRFAVATPFLAPRAYFRSTAREKQLEALFRAASVCFVAERKRND